MEKKQITKQFKWKWFPMVFFGKKVGFAWELNLSVCLGGLIFIGLLA